MKSGQFSKIVLIALFCASTLQVSESHALTITNDIKSGITNVKNWFNDLKDLKVVQDTISFAQKTSAAIGDAKESISEFSSDVYGEIAEMKKTYDEYKAEVEEYKEEYEEYKKEYEEYKQMAEDYKQMASDGINTAKGMASAAGDLASSTVNTVKDKAGIKDKDSSSSGNSAAPEGLDQETAVAGNQEIAEAGNAAAGSGAVAGGLAGAAGLTGAANIAADVNPTSGRQPFTNAETVANSEAKVSGTVAAGEIAAAGNVKDINSSSAVNAVQSTAGNMAVVSGAGAVKAAGIAGISGTSSSAAVKNNLKAQALQAVEKTDAKAVSTVNSSAAKVKSVVENPNTTRSIQLRQNSTKAVSPTRKVFTRDKLSFMKPETEYRSYASVQTKSALAFADLLSMVPLQDNGTDKNKNFIIPKPLAKRCDLTSKTALESTGKNKYAIDKCLVSINDASQGAQTLQFQSPRQDYLDGKREIAAVYIVEGYKALSDTQKMTEDIIPSIELAQTDTTKDIYSQVVETNKAIVTTISGLLKVYTTKVLLESYNNYDLAKYDFKTQSED